MHTSGDIVVNQGATFRSFSPLTIQSGSVKGNGTIGGNVQIHGTISPGESAGELTMDGNVMLFDDSHVLIELGGLTSTSQYDQISVTGSATLNGLLNIDLINGFLPLAGNSFDIFDWGSVSGKFATFDLPMLAARTLLEYEPALRHRCALSNQWSQR